MIKCLILLKVLLSAFYLIERRFFQNLSLGLSVRVEHPNALNVFKSVDPYSCPPHDIQSNGKCSRCGMSFGKFI